MKTILIATDFSTASGNAAEYGVRLAREINANVILFNAFEVPRPATGLNISVSRYAVMLESDKTLLSEADILDPERNLIEVVSDEGPAEEAILNIANERNVDFIVVGMKGSGKSFRRLFGSTATSLAKKTNIPLIVVPQGVDFKKPETIVFAIDEIETKKELPAQVRNITTLFNSKLYVVKVLEDEKEQRFDIQRQPAQTGRHISPLDPSYQFPIDSDTTHGLSRFMQQNGADILIMTPHKHEWMERLLRKSATVDMMFHTKTPLLILPQIEQKVADRFPTELLSMN